MKIKSTKDLPKATRVMLIDWDILNNNSLRLYFEKVPVYENRIDAYGNYDVSIGRITRKDYSIYHDKSSGYSKDVIPKERFACSFYLFDDNKVLFSRSYGIDLRRVAYYVDLLTQGARPKIIVYTHYLHHDHFDCPYYIIDGHHKALAYFQLEVDICTVFITKDDYGKTFDNDTIAAVLRQS